MAGLAVVALCIAAALLLLIRQNLRRPGP